LSGVDQFLALFLREADRVRNPVLERAGREGVAVAQGAENRS
jgi:hypothetical protein